MDFIAANLEVILTFIATALGSSSLWAYVMKRMENRSLDRQLLVGLARDRISFLAQRHLREGCISQDDYEILEGLYKPYLGLGGNGTIKKLFSEVEKLRLKTTPIKNYKDTEND